MNGLPAGKERIRYRTIIELPTARHGPLGRWGPVFTARAPHHKKRHYTANDLTFRRTPAHSARPIVPNRMTEDGSGTVDDNAPELMPIWTPCPPANSWTITVSVAAQLRPRKPKPRNSEFW